MDGLFTHRNEIEGKVGIGKVPNELHSILDDICEDDTKNKELCKKYGDSKRNFYTISNLLLQQYDIKNKI